MRDFVRTIIYVWDESLFIILGGLVFMSLSTLKREQIKKDLKNKDFDVVIIGGGITGAGIALDASQRGMKVALVEMQDFAQGTSSRSTKLVHGGLRYLKTTTSWRCCRNWS